MGTKRYGPKVIRPAKELFVYEGWSPDKISEFFDGKPSKNTVINWATEEDKKTGKTWYEEREEWLNTRMNSVTPKMIEQKYQEKIWMVLNKPDFNNGDSDALRKLQLDFKQIVNPKDNIPVLYGFLEELIDYFNKYHNEVVDKEFLEAIREYKNHQRSKLLN